MTNNWYQNVISDYERQLGRSDVSRAMQITIGTNLAATWETEDQVWMVAEYKMPILAASGATIGNRGQIITYGLPLTLEPSWEVIVHDYDVALRAQLNEYAAARTQLRIWVWGVLVAVGYVASVVTQMPMDRAMNVTFILSGLRMYKASAHDQDVTDFDLSSPIHMLDMPFAIDAASLTTYQTHSILYGTEFMP